MYRIGNTVLKNLTNTCVCAGVSEQVIPPVETPEKAPAVVLWGKS